jgi:hypothetical protein
VPRDGVSDQHGRCHHRGPGRLGYLSEHLAGPAAGAVRGEQGAQAEPRRRPDIADAPYRSGNVLIHHTSPVIPGRDHGRARAATAGARAVRGCREPGQATGTIRGAPATDAHAVPDARGAAAPLAATTGTISRVILRDADRAAQRQPALGRPPGEGWLGLAQAACLRHGCATFLLAQGVPARAIREVLDHGEITVQMTLRYARMAITELYPHALGRSRARPRTQWTIFSLSSGRRPEIGGVIVMRSQLLSDSDRNGSEDQPERRFAWSVVARSEGLEPPTF